LLATKLNVPPARDLLGRSRLTERLNQGMAREVILVCTPAGFGKPTLLAGWATSARQPVAWLSLDLRMTTRHASGGTWSRRLIVCAKAWGDACCHCWPLLVPCRARAW
jgi:hypothetical protein